MQGHSDRNSGFTRVSRLSGFVDAGGGDILDMKEYLSQLKTISRRLERKKQEKEELLAIAARVTASYSGMPGAKGGKSDKVGDIAVKLAELENETNNDIVRMLELKREIVSVIERLDDREYEVLYKRYVEFKSLSEIGQELDKSYQTVINIHAVGLRKLEAMKRSRRITI